MAGRLTVCNMSIEGGARAGLIAPDETTFAYVEGRPFAPKGEDFDRAVAYWKTLPSDPGAQYDTIVRIDGSEIAPMVTWGTSPEAVLPITGAVPDPADVADEAARGQMQRMLDYMGLTAGTKLTDIPVDVVFVGSCTNARIEDLRAAAAVARGRKVAEKRPRAHRARLRPGQAPGRGGGASPRSSSTPASSGGSPAAPCVWR